MKIKEIIKENNLEELFSKVKIGLEKEGQRVLKDMIIHISKLILQNLN